MSAALYDWWVAHVQLIQVNTRHILLIVRSFFDLVSQFGMLYTLHTQTFIIASPMFFDLVSQLGMLYTLHTYTFIIASPMYTFVPHPRFLIGM